MRAISRDFLPLTLLIQHANASNLAACVTRELDLRGWDSCDRERVGTRRDELEWASVDDGPGLMATVLRPAANHDAEVFRAVVRWDLQLDPVDAIYANHELVERARAVMATNPKAAEEPSRPGRDDLLEIAGAALRVAYRPSDLG